MDAIEKLRRVQPCSPLFCRVGSSQHDTPFGFHGVSTGPCGDLAGARAPADFPADVQGLWI